MNDEIVSQDASVTTPEDPAAVSARSPGLNPGSVLAGRYHVGEVLGRGGTGVVVRAHDRILCLDVAIKLLREDLEADRRWTERLVREVKTTRQIRHPNVCRVFDFQHADGRAFIVMELAEGTLAQELERGQGAAPPLEARLADIRAIVDGLAAIHEAGIVHRDVSARNILRIADGRLVLSDLGLAIDSGDHPATLEGGTVAYMAPELVAGARASPASDIWALGIVMYEVVFGGRPVWRDDAVARGLERPRRKLTRAEEVVLALCRDCTAALPAARPQSATDVLTRLDTGGHGRRRLAKRIVAIGGAVLLVAGGAIILHNTIRRRGRPSAPSGEGPMDLTGEPRDWTETSRVLASIPDKIFCMVSLPRSHVVRIVWGTPPKAEDIDVKTGIRHPSPLVPAAYAHGCPDVSPDGHDLIFQGFNQDGHPGIFMSTHPDGSEARFAVSAADPSYLSEPRWIAGGRAFVFDADTRHIGAFDRSTERSNILPFDTNRDDYSTFRFVREDRVFSLRSAGPGDIHVQAISWPNASPDISFTVKNVGASWEGTTNDHIFYAGELTGNALVEVDTLHHRATRLGIVRNSYLTNPRVVHETLAFISVAESSDAWEGEGATLRQITHVGKVGQAARCFNGDLLVSRESTSGSPEFGRLMADGTFRPLFADRPITAPACSRLRDEWWYSDFSGPKPITYDCVPGRCTVVGGGFLVNALSPDESRIASIGLNTQGQYIQWFPSRGGPAHEIATSETNCPPAWSSNTTLWISKRHSERFVWTEVDVDTGVATGKTMPGGSDCADGSWDPLFVPGPNLRVIASRRSEVRAIPLANVGSDPIDRDREKEF